MHHASPCTVGVLVNTDPEMRELNRQFRAVDASTDVLTFPAPENPANHAGDIAISWDTAARQAALRKATVGEEVQFLAIHGTLHLLGFDDETPDDQRLMVQEMNRVAQELGLRQDLDWWSRAYGDSD